MSYPTSACYSLTAHGAALSFSCQTGWWQQHLRAGTALEKPLTWFVLPGCSSKRLQDRHGDKAKKPLQALLAFNNLLGHGPNTAMSQYPTSVLNI